MADPNPNTTVAGMKQAERTYYNALASVDEQLGYLRYRLEETGKGAVQGYAIKNRYVKLPNAARQAYIGAARADRLASMAAAVVPPPAAGLKLAGRPPPAGAAGVTPARDGDSLDPANWDPSSSSEESWEATTIRDLRNLTNIRDWKYVKLLYDNAGLPGIEILTQVALYVALDSENRQIVDRLVVKTVDAPNQQQADQMQQEYDYARLLRDCKNIVQVRARTVDPNNNLLFRIYSDYAPHGDLHGLLTRYDPGRIEYYNANRQRRSLLRQFPEPFVWLVFHGLAEALYMLNTGRCAEDREAADVSIASAAKPGWKPLLHGDIKPMNVFLAQPDDPYMGYPKPLLGDFDRVTEFGNATQFSWARPLDTGTRTWNAPENVFQTAVDWTDQTDIWSVGMIIWNMMHSSLGQNPNDNLRELAIYNGNLTFGPDDDTMCEDGAELRSWIGESEDVPNGGPTRVALARALDRWNGVYTKPLHDLVRQCLKTNFDERPGHLELRIRTKRGMRAAKRRFGPFENSPLAHHVRLDFKDDEFVIGELLPGDRSNGGGSEDDQGGDDDNDSPGGDDGPSSGSDGSLGGSDSSTGGSYSSSGGSDGSAGGSDGSSGAGDDDGDSTYIPTLRTRKKQRTDEERKTDPAPTPPRVRNRPRDFWDVLDNEAATREQDPTPTPTPTPTPSRGRKRPRNFLDDFLDHDEEVAGKQNPTVEDDGEEEPVRKRGGSDKVLPRGEGAVRKKVNPVVPRRSEFGGATGRMIRGLFGFPARA